jgi:ubiquinone/menaquinone biosynthesis C-methylase UbiE
MRVFFHLLYHPFAFTYDLVAWMVSFGKWDEWIEAVLPYVEGNTVLELGHGPGHLQGRLREGGRSTFGLDESAQMGRIARRRLGSSARLVRGLTQAMPFGRGVFSTLVSTFPSEYIIDPRTLSEAHRCLADGGGLIVLPGAWPGNSILRWIYRITGEIPSNLTKGLIGKLEQPFSDAGFTTTTEVIEGRSSTLVVILARKRGKSC